MDANALFQPQGYFPPMMVAGPAPFIDSAQFASPLEKASSATGLPSWLIVGAAVGVGAWLLIAGVR